jgi:ferrochelatase
MNEKPFDAILIVSFGGPEGMDDVMPFLENVLRGKPVPRERMLEVAEHYRHFDGISPINEQNRRLIAALKKELEEHGIELPVYWGNRNWHPMIPDTLRQMKEDGVQKAIAFFTSMFSCYSGCRQYRENILEAQATIGADAPEVHKVRMAFNHPLFVESSAERVRQALEQVPADRRSDAHIAFTAHSIPMSMSDGSKYTVQLHEACRIIMEQVGSNPWRLVFQSRSGPPSQPWLEPDICDYLQELKDTANPTDVVCMPVGFVSDHMEVLFDLDTEAKELCDELGIHFVRAKTVGIHPKFISMIRELILERTSGAEKRAIGNMPPNWDVCPKDCCTYDRSAGRPAAFDQTSKTQ